MYRKLLPMVVVVSVSLFCWADVPAPPVNQDIGMDDVAMDDMVEADCRLCHDTGVPDRHHLLMGEPIPPGTILPDPGSEYECLTCHNVHFEVVRDCVSCHTERPHHTTPVAQAGDCVSCHGDLVDNMDDGHYIPSYSPSLVTPKTSVGDGLPLNSRLHGAGACNYCHDNDGLPTPVILENWQLHHRADFNENVNCVWCHDVHVPWEERIRRCEGCHGPDSLHNIQADSPNPANSGALVVGGEDAGYGHVGHNDDCWGCHGFAQSGAPRSGPIIPTISTSDHKVIVAGTDRVVILDGSAFANYAMGTLYESSVTLTAADGSSVILTSDLVLGQEAMAVTIPGDTAPGNYNLQVVKHDDDGSTVKSNPVVISIIPKVTISRTVNSRGTVSISGHGFGDYLQGSGTSVTGTIMDKKSKKSRKVTATVISWSDTKIKATFRASPDEVTVHSVFGTDTLKIGRLKVLPSRLRVLSGRGR